MAQVLILHSSDEPDLQKILNLVNYKDSLVQQYLPSTYCGLVIKKEKGIFSKVFLAVVVYKDFASFI